jgi:hypothetical protein
LANKQIQIASAYVMATTAITRINAMTGSSSQLDFDNPHKTITTNGLMRYIAYSNLLMCTNILAKKNLVGMSTQ